MRNTYKSVRWMMALGIGLLAVISAGQDKAAPKTQQEKISYALGVDLGNQLRKSSITVDPAIFEQGLKDALSGAKTLMTEEEIRAAISDLQAEQKRRAAAARKGSPENESELEMLGAYNAKAGNAFLAANRSKEGVVTLPSGLQYQILKEGKGPKPTLDDMVTCNVRATTLDGTELEDTAKRQQPKTLKVKGSIKALTEALPLMPVGSKWELFVPPSLAYGESGMGPIGPNATLKYEVELLSIK